MKVPIILFYFLFGGQGLTCCGSNKVPIGILKNLEKLLLKFTGKKKPTAIAKTTLRIRIMREESRCWDTTRCNAAVITPRSPITILHDSLGQS